MKNKFIVKREWSLLFCLLLVLVIAQAWSIPNKSNAPVKTNTPTIATASTAAVSLIKICGGASTFEEGAVGCSSADLQVRLEEQCQGDVPMNVFLTNIHPNPEENTLYDLPTDIPAIYTMHEAAPGNFIIDGPHTQAMLKGKIPTTSGGHVPVFGIDIGLYTTATNEVGCEAGVPSIESFPIVVRIMQKVGTDSYDYYPLSNHADPNNGIFSCDVFLETHCVCYGGTCLNEGIPDYNPNVCMVCECKEDVKTEDKIAAPSDVTLAETKGISDVSLSPNPFKENFTLSFELEKAENVQIRIIDFQGKEMKAASLDLTEGSQSQRFNTKGYPSGIYYLQMIAGNQQITKKLIVIN